MPEKIPDLIDEMNEAELRESLRNILLRSNINYYRIESLRDEIKILKWEQERFLRWYDVFVEMERLRKAETFGTEKY